MSAVLKHCRLVDAANHLAAQLPPSALGNSAGGSRTVFKIAEDKVPPGLEEAVRAVHSVTLGLLRALQV